MEAPKCRVCGDRHWGNEHIWPEVSVKGAVVDIVVDAPKVVDKPKKVVDAVVDKIRSGKRYLDIEKRREYQREWVKRKRAMRVVG